MLERDALWHRDASLIEHSHYSGGFPLNTFLAKFIFRVCFALHLGTEEEHETVGPDSRPVAASVWLWDAERLQRDKQGRIRWEGPEMQLENVTGICMTPDDIEADLRDGRDTLRALGDEFGFVPLSNGTPVGPFDMAVFPYDERLVAIAEEHGLEVLEGMHIMGLHHHIGMRDMDEAIRWLNGMRTLIPFFLAMAACTPMYCGEGRGYASERIMRYLQFGEELGGRQFVPPHIRDAAHLEDLAREEGFWEDPGSCWWFVRINARTGTGESRINDMQQAPEQSADHCALFEAASHMVLRGEIMPDPTRTRSDILSETEAVAKSEIAPGNYAATLRAVHAFAVANDLSAERIVRIAEDRGIELAA